MVSGGEIQRGSIDPTSKGVGGGGQVPLPQPGGFDTSPIITLLDPRTAPQELLDNVQPSDDFLKLVAATAAGPLALEVYFAAPGTQELTRGLFIPPGSAEATSDFETAFNAPLTERYHHLVLPDGAEYDLTVRAPLSFAGEWSEPKHTNLSGGDLFKMGMSAFEIKRLFPDVEIDQYSGGYYNVTAVGGTRPSLSAVVRTDNAQPLFREQEIMSYSTRPRYNEKPIALTFTQSQREPDTAVSVMSHRLTMRKGEKADAQRMVFTLPDGHERDNSDSQSGLVEVILFEGTAVKVDTLLLEPVELPRTTYEDPYDGFTKGLGTRSATFGGPYSAGETRFRAPKSVEMSTQLTLGRTAVAAFRLALIG